MRNLFYFLLAINLFSCKTPQQEENKFFQADNDNFIYSGRIGESDSGTKLITSGASVTARVYGDTAMVFLESSTDQHHYVSLEINEEYIGRFRIKDESLQLPLPNKEEGNLLKIFKDTEASNGGIIFKGISAGKIKRQTTLERPTIEFIGNSITCGMAADTREIPCGDGEWYDQHNAYLAYGPRTARALGADFVLNCVSGRGMYRNWNDEDQPAMPDLYITQNLDGDEGKKAIFDKKAPDVVSIALGTNDLSLGDGEKERKEFNEEKFVENYINFIEMIYSHYPNTKIALLSSPMVGEKEGVILIKSLKKIRNNFPDREIAVFEFEKMNAGGCTSHPDIEDHEKIADLLIPFFKELLNEKV